MPAPDNSRIVELAMVLRATAPDVWREFTAALEKYSTETNANLMSAHPEMLVRAQGMAIGVRELVGVLADAPRIHEESQAARLKKNVR